jgi:multidrug efflux pump subunit AcrB
MAAPASLSCLPAAAIDALLTLLLFGQGLNLYSFLGIILLMIVDFAIDAERNEAMKPEQAI